MKTKYLGGAYRCRRCGQHTTLRLWWASMPNQTPPKEARVAYYCGSQKCTTRWRQGTKFFLTKEALLIDLATRALTDDYEGYRHPALSDYLNTMQPYVYLPLETNP